MVEKDREKQYAKSFYEDFASDEKTLSSLASWMKLQEQESDSLLLLPPKADIKKPANGIYIDYRSIIRNWI